jgi:hypothetical protein
MSKEDYNPLTDQAATELIEGHRRAGHDTSIVRCDQCYEALGYLCITCNGRVDLPDHLPDRCALSSPSGPVVVSGGTE